MSLVAVVIGFLSTYFIDLVEVTDTELIKSTLELDAVAETEELSILDRTVQTITVSDFVDLFSRQNIIALILFAILFGLATERFSPLIPKPFFKENHPYIQQSCTIEARYRAYMGWQ